MKSWCIKGNTNLLQARPHLTALSGIIHRDRAWNQIFQPSTFSAVSLPPGSHPSNYGQPSVPSELTLLVHSKPSTSKISPGLSYTHSIRCVSGVPLWEGDKAEFPPKVTCAALREMNYKPVLEEHQCCYSQVNFLMQWAEIQEYKHWLIFAVYLQ